MQADPVDARNRRFHTRPQPQPRIARRRPMRKQLLALALIAAGCAAQAADTPGSNPNAPQVTSADRMANARKALAAKDFSTAQRELNLVVREDPRNADAH